MQPPETFVIRVITGAVLALILLLGPVVTGRISKTIVRGKTLNQQTVMAILSATIVYVAWTMFVAPQILGGHNVIGEMARQLSGWNGAFETPPILWGMYSVAVHHISFRF